VFVGINGKRSAREVNRREKGIRCLFYDCCDNTQFLCPLEMTTVSKLRNTLYSFEKIYMLQEMWKLQETKLQCKIKVFVVSEGNKSVRRCCLQPCCVPATCFGRLIGCFIITAMSPVS